VRSDSASGSSPERPALERAKASIQKSPIVHSIARVCRGLALLTKRIEPALEGTPAKLPFAVINGIVQVVEVRAYQCKSSVSSNMLRSQGVIDITEGAEEAKDVLERRAKIIADALRNTKDDESLKRITALEEYVPSGIHDINAYVEPVV